MAEGKLLSGAAREDLRAELAALGWDAVGFAAAATPPPLAGLSAWLAAGRHADMAWMAKDPARRADPGLVHPGTRAVVALGVNYATPSGAGRLARYALYSDYHDTLAAALHGAVAALSRHSGLPPADHRAYADTGPVLERGWAERAGLGFRGKNGMLISRQAGNWLLLACVLTRAAIEPDPPLRSAVGPEGAARTGLLCGSCTRCLDACPTGALPEPGVVDARRCISYLTIEHRGPIPRELRPMLGERVFGCDACLEVCPWNRFAREGRRALLESRQDLASQGLADWLALDELGFRNRFRRSPVKRAKWVGFLRNALVAAGNSADLALVEPVLRLATHPAPLVRIHAVWAAGRLLGGAEAAVRLQSARQVEEDAGVQEEYSLLHGTPRNRD